MPKVVLSHLYSFSLASKNCKNIRQRNTYMGLKTPLGEICVSVQNFPHNCISLIYILISPFMIHINKTMW